MHRTGALARTTEDSPVVSDNRSRRNDAFFCDLAPDQLYNSENGGRAALHQVHLKPKNPETQEWRLSMKVKDVMHKGVDWVSPNTPVTELAKLMRGHDIGCIPIGEDDRLIGMVTDRDIVCKGLASNDFDAR